MKYLIVLILLLNNVSCTSLDEVDYHVESKRIRHLCKRVAKRFKDNSTVALAYSNCMTKYLDKFSREEKQKKVDKELESYLWITLGTSLASVILGVLGMLAALN